MKQRLLVLAADTAYQTDEFIDAARRMDVDVVVGNDRCQVLASVWREALIDGPWPLDFRRPDKAAATIVRRAEAEPIAGIVATDETTAVIAALAAARLGLRHNPAPAARAAANKLLFRRALTAAGLGQPRFAEVAMAMTRQQVSAACANVGFPLVLKPQHLSASRGVMRADNEAELWQNYCRLGALLSSLNVRGPNPELADTIVAEQFIGGDEVAFEGLLLCGQLERIALFDKPDPLDGPFFAETIYATPSRLSTPTQLAIFDAVAAAANAIGLVEGPVHAELRLATSGPIVLELAARSIGGLCSRTLRYGAGISLEELVIRHSLGRPVCYNTANAHASGVMMLPVPSAGVLRGIDGIDDARAVEHICDVTITARNGDRVDPLPEGHTYLGFVFATAPSSEQVIHALRVASDALRFRIVPRL